MMKSLALVTLLLVVTPFSLRAQTNAGSATRPAPSSPEVQALAILTPDQRLEYAKAHEAALANDAALRAEGDQLKEQFKTVMTQGTPAQKEALLEKVDSHRQKLRAAMLKVDPTLGPVFAQIDKFISEAKAKGAAAPAPQPSH